jgi:hypothetical protein
MEVRRAARILARMRARLLVPLTLLAVAAFPAAARATSIGLSDQDPAAFSDARLRALHLGYARVVVPWDAATSEPARVQAWLGAVAAAGLTPHVAFEHAGGTRCPDAPCTAPSRAAYGAAVRRFVARFRQVRTYTTWNEANHVSQPVASRPEAVAGYYEELRAACPSCTVVAGDVLDSGSFVRWIQRFRAATSADPRLWGLHNYSDVTYGRSSGTDAMLAAVPGRLWIEETGGIVTLRNAAGRVTLATDEARAAHAVARALRIARTRPRIGRVYVYQWRAGATDRFDSGLVRPDGTARASLGVLATALGGVPAVTARISGARLVVRVRCRAGDGRCRGRVALALRTRTSGAWRTVALGTRAYSTTAARPTATLAVRVPAALRRRARRVRVAVRPTLPAGAPATTVSRALA